MKKKKSKPINPYETKTKSNPSNQSTHLSPRISTSVSQPPTIADLNLTYLSLSLSLS